MKLEVAEMLWDDLLNDAALEIIELERKIAHRQRMSGLGESVSGGGRGLQPLSGIRGF